MNLSAACGFMYLDVARVGGRLPKTLTRETMLPHSRELCEDVGNATRRALGLVECECPCHEGDERALMSERAHE